MPIRRFNVEGGTDSKSASTKKLQFEVKETKKVETVKGDKAKSDAEAELVKKTIKFQEDEKKVIDSEAEAKNNSDLALETNHNSESAEVETNQNGHVEIENSAQSPPPLSPIDEKPYQQQLKIEVTENKKLATMEEGKVFDNGLVEQKHFANIETPKKLNLKLLPSNLQSMREDDSMSLMTDDDDAKSMIIANDENGRIRKRSISYENPELMKLIKKAGRDGIRHHSDMPLGALSEGGAPQGHRTSSVPMFLASTLDGGNDIQETVSEDADNENSTSPGSAAAAAADTIYETFKNSETGKVSVRKFLNALTANGIRTTDPRLDESMHKLKRIMKRYGADFEAANTLHLDEVEFKNVIEPNAMTISRFLRTNFVVPEWNEFCRHIFRLYSMCKNNDEGKPSDFIPQLEAYDRNLWGVALCSVDGQRFSTGDFNVPFCLQAASRVLNYAIVLNDYGAEKVHGYVGQEPSGRNAKELVLDEYNKPHNPMINGGAIVVSALLKAEEKHMADRFDAVDSMYKKMAGSNEFIGFCNQAYLSERQVSFRNYAMGYFLRENKCLPGPERLNETLELMLQLCAVEVSCESLAVMAATLANGGVCPITGEYVIGSQCVRDVLSLMYTTGMNDYSGQFAFHVGLPAKSSISGAIMLVIPNVMGIALWSPPLDNRTNSVRGIQFCTEFVKVFNFHNYDNLRFTQKKLDPRKMQVENKAHQVVLTLFSAANGDLTALSRFFLQGVDLTVADYDRRTPLHIAAAEGHLNCVKFLVEKARVPCRPIDRWNNTPADDARYHAHPEIADYLENWDLKRTTTQQKPQAVQQPVNGVAQPARFVNSENAFSPIKSKNKNRDGYDASQSEEEEEDYDSGEGSSLPSSTPIVKGHQR